MSKLEEFLLKTEGMTDPKVSDPCFNSDLEMKTIEYDPNGQPNSQRAVDQALREGLDVVYPQDNELQIDIDNEHSKRLLENQLLILNKFVGPCNYISNASKSGEKWKMHITLVFDRTFTNLERIGLQAMLGSDRVRELLSYVKLCNGDPHPTLFLEKKPEQKLLTEGTNDPRN
jgi:hypothetical protein